MPRCQRRLPRHDTARRETIVPDVHQADFKPSRGDSPNNTNADLPFGSSAIVGSFGASGGSNVWRRGGQRGPVDPRSTPAGAAPSAPLASRRPWMAYPSPVPQSKFAPHPSEPCPSSPCRKVGACVYASCSCSDIPCSMTKSQVGSSNTRVPAAADRSSRRRRTARATSSDVAPLKGRSGPLGDTARRSDRPHFRCCWAL